MKTITNPIYATIALPTDRVPILLTEAGKTKMTGHFLAVDHLPPTGKCGPFPVYDHEITSGEIIQTKPVSIYKTKTGWQYAGGCPVWLGKARYFRNLAD